MNINKQYAAKYTFFYAICTLALLYTFKCIKLLICRCDSKTKKKKKNRKRFVYFLKQKAYSSKKKKKLTASNGTGTFNNKQ